jgi:hypothetical protein
MYPFQSIPRSARGRYLAGLCVLVVIFMLMLSFTGGPLRTLVSLRGIVSLEFALTPQRADEILIAWGNDGRLLAALNLGLDYGYLVVYASAIALACSMIVDVRLSPIFSTVGAVLGWGVLMAGFLDAVENYALIRTLLHPPVLAWTRLAFVAATIKFALVGLALLYVVVGSIAVGYRRLVR